MWVLTCPVAVALISLLCVMQDKSELQTRDALLSLFSTGLSFPDVVKTFASGAETLDLSPKNLAKNLLPSFVQRRVMHYLLDQQAATHLTNIPGTIPVEHFDMKAHGVTVEIEMEYEPGKTIHVMHIGDFDPAKPTIIAHHGIKGHWFNCPQGIRKEIVDNAYRIKALQVFADAGYNVVAYSAPGFGMSTGTPSESSYKAAAAVFAAHVAENYEPGKTIIFGESMGSAKAMILVEALAEEHRFHPALVSLVAPFDSALNMVKQDFPHLKETLDNWWQEKIDSQARIKHINPDVTKLHIVTMRDDSAVPLERSRPLIDKARCLGVDVHHQQLPGIHVQWNAAAVIRQISALYDASLKLPGHLDSIEKSWPVSFKLVETKAVETPRTFSCSIS